MELSDCCKGRTYIEEGLRICLKCGRVCGVLPDKEPEVLKTPKKIDKKPFVFRVCKYCDTIMHRRKGESQKSYDKKKSCGNRSCMRKWRKESGTDWIEDKYY